MFSSVLRLDPRADALLNAARVALHGVENMEELSLQVASFARSWDGSRPLPRACLTPILDELMIII